MRTDLEDADSDMIFVFLPQRQFYGAHVPILTSVPNWRKVKVVVMGKGVEDDEGNGGKVRVVEDGEVNGER